jgi:hypothetical protein
MPGVPADDVPQSAFVEQRFTVATEPRPRGGLAIRLPFDPSIVWGERERYDVTGDIQGHKVRGALTIVDGAYYLLTGPSWCRDFHPPPGQMLSVRLQPEGPPLAPDFLAALEAEPEAQRFFFSVATFYRKNYVRWIEEAKRPETRAKRIADTVALLKAGHRER